MLKDGDRVLVCISGSSSSLCLLHLLHQFCRTRQLQVQLAAITIGGSDGGVDPRALMLYLKELGVTFFYEPLASNDQLQDQLLQHARHRQYNVLAMASTLDKLADRFLTSLLYRGELTALQAVQGACGAKDTTTDDVRIVRPLLYLREHLFDEFALSQGFPSRSSSRGHDACPNGTLVSPTVELLRGQEKVNPHVYNNIRSALKPILSLRIEPSKSAYEMLRSSLNTRE